MKKTILVILAAGLLSLGYSAAKKILVDNIHGADFIGATDSTGVTSTGIPIDFYSIFPDDEVTILTPDSLPIGDIYVEETITGITEKTYNCDIPMYYIPACLYVYVKSSSDEFWERANGVLKNPQGEITSELFQGSAHQDFVDSGTWSIELELNPVLSYDVRIGCGEFLFKNQSYGGKYDLSDYDVMIRIKDNSYFAVSGNPPLYKVTDLSALNLAFTNGLSFINVDHFFDSMWDKPFIHFYSEDEFTANIEIDFPGNYTLLSNNPNVSEDKNAKVTKASWDSHKIGSKSQNEIIYEGALNNKLNFLEFDLSSGFNVLNRIDHKLEDLFIFKYESSNLYKFSEVGSIEPSEKLSIDNWEFLNTEEVLSRIKEIFYQKGIDQGLTSEEIDHLVNDFRWIESLLFRAKINQRDYFGFYYFGKEVYDKLVGFNCEPYPEELNRSMWVMLSFIRDRKEEPVTDLNMKTFKNDIKKGLKVNEYGVNDEYYTNNYFESENELFGIEINSYTDQLTVNSLNFYDNDVANSIYFGSNLMAADLGIYDYVCEDSENMGVLFQFGNEVNPVSYGKAINDNGQLLVIGTSYFFNDGNIQGKNFLNSAVTQMVDNQILTGIEESSNLITDYDLKAYPNPFNPSTVIKFNLNVDSPVELVIYNLQGQQVVSLFKGNLNSGQHKYDFTADQLSSGIFYAVLKVNNLEVDTKKLLLVK